MQLSTLRKYLNAEVMRAGGAIPAPFLANHYLNMGGRQFLLDSKLRRKLQASLTTPAAGVTDHTFHADTIEIGQALWNNLRLAKTSRDELSIFDPTWRTAANGTPHSFFPITNTQIRLYPPPSDTSAVGADLILGWSTDMSADGDDSAGTGREVPETYSMALVYFAADKLMPSDHFARQYRSYVEQAVAEVAKSFHGFLDQASTVPANG